MAGYPELYVIRHGQTEWNVAGRHQGRRDSPLTQTGVEQAIAMGRMLAGLGRDWRAFDAFRSPQGRATHTAELLLAAIGLDARPDPRLMEVAFGDWEGLTLSEISEDAPGIEQVFDEDPFGWHFRAPAGETFDQMAARCRAFLDDLTGPAIVVTHGITSRVLRGTWLGLDQVSMSDLPGGQGIIHHLGDAGHRTLVPGGVGPQNPRIGDNRA